jgi:hypothetical protein
MMKSLFLCIALLSTVTAIFVIVAMDRLEWSETLRNTVGSAVLNFGIYFTLRWLERPERKATKGTKGDKGK